MGKIVVTSALPYANGPIHLGHLVEYIQTDIWVRAKKMQNLNCLYFCADDAHGTPIMLKANEMNITAEALIEKVQAEHIADFAKFDINFDNYHTTHSAENKEISNIIYQRLVAAGFIKREVIQQMFDESKQMFLPDRFIKGTCPKCKSSDQYGDNCEVCGETYSPKDLLDSYSVLSNQTPIEKDTEHLFFDLPKLEEFLGEYLNNLNLQPEIKNKLQEWFVTGLKEWDISRDAPYFGFEIPNEVDKYFYVWLDAPVGYIASYKNHADKLGENYLDFWENDNPENKLYHFIGKDIVYFHALFWQAMLKAAGFKLSDGIFAHGFLTLNGQKMSKSRNTFITAAKFADVLPTNYLRYFFATRLNPSVVDIDLNFNEFKTKINSELIGKIINLASRSASFLNKFFHLKLSSKLDKIGDDLILKLQKSHALIIDNYDKRDYASNIRELTLLADNCNQYFDSKAPWLLAKDENSQNYQQESEDLHQITTTSLNAYRILMIYLSPIVPKISQTSKELFNESGWSFDSVNKILLNHEINKYTPLAQKIQDEDIEKFLEN